MCVCPWFSDLITEIATGFRKWNSLVMIQVMTHLGCEIYSPILKSYLSLYTILAKFY